MKREQRFDNQGWTLAFAVRVVRLNIWARSRLDLGKK